MSFVDSNRRTFLAGADLTNFQYCLVKLNSAGAVVPATAATDQIIGICETNVLSGDYTVVRLLQGAGTYNAFAGGTIAVGDQLTSDASSHLLTTVTAGNTVVGTALHAAVAGDLVEFLPSKGKV